MHSTAHCQHRIGGGQGQPVDAQHPKDHHQQQDERQNGDLGWRDGQDVTDQETVELGEAVAVQGGDENAQSHCGGGKDADDRVTGHTGAALHPGKEQGKDYCQRHRTPGGIHQTTEGANGYAGKGGVPQSVGEEGHALFHHHGGQQSKKGGDDQNGQQGVLHEVHLARLRPLEGEQVDEGVPERHCASPPFCVGW